MISVIESSASRGSSGPRPSISATTSLVSRWRSSRVTEYPFSSMTRSTIAATFAWTSVAALASNSVSEAPTTSSTRRSLMSRSRSPRAATWASLGSAGGSDAHSRAHTGGLAATLEVASLLRAPDPLEQGHDLRLP